MSHSSRCPECHRAWSAAGPFLNPNGGYHACPGCSEPCGDCLARAHDRFVEDEAAITNMQEKAKRAWNAFADAQL